MTTLRRLEIIAQFAGCRLEVRARQIRAGELRGQVGERRVGAREVVARPREVRAALGQVDATVGERVARAAVGIALVYVGGWVLGEQEWWKNGHPQRVASARAEMALLALNDKCSKLFNCS